MKAIELKNEAEQFLSGSRAFRAEGTISVYRERIAHWMRECGDREVSQASVVNWMDEMSRRGTSANSIRAYIIALKSFFTWLDERGVIRIKIKTPKPANTQSDRVPITEQEYARLISAAVMHKGYMAYAIRLGWATGLRMGDIALLKWSQIDLETEIIRLMPQKTSRQKKTVEIPMSKSIVHLLEEIKHFGGTDEYVMPSMARTYNRWKQIEICRKFSMLCKEAGVVGKSFHCLRHSFVTRHLDAGVSPAIVASMTGHSLKEIMTYSHVSMQAKRESLVE